MLLTLDSCHIKGPCFLLYNIVVSFASCYITRLCPLLLLYYMIMSLTFWYITGVCPLLSVILQGCATCFQFNTFYDLMPQSAGYHNHHVTSSTFFTTMTSSAPLWSEISVCRKLGTKYQQSQKYWIQQSNNNKLSSVHRIDVVITPRVAVFVPTTVVLPSRIAVNHYSK